MSQETCGIATPSKFRPTDSESCGGGEAGGKRVRALPFTIHEGEACQADYVAEVEAEEKPEAAEFEVMEAEIEWGNGASVEAVKEDGTGTEIGVRALPFTIHEGEACQADYVAEVEAEEKPEAAGFEVMEAEIELGNGASVEAVKEDGTGTEVGVGVESAPSSTSLSPASLVAKISSAAHLLEANVDVVQPASGTQLVSMPMPTPTHFIAEAESIPPETVQTLLAQDLAKTAAESAKLAALAARALFRQVLPGSDSGEATDGIGKRKSSPPPRAKQQRRSARA